MKLKEYYLIDKSLCIYESTMPVCIIVWVENTNPSPINNLRTNISPRD